MIYEEVYDYRVHLRIAEAMSRGDIAVTPPHFLFHVITMALYLSLFNISFQATGLITTLLCFISLALIMYYFFLEKTGIPLYATLLIIGSAMIVAPITLLAPFDGHYYFGYIGINVFHNPTTIVLKPFVLLGFYYAVAAVQPELITGGRKSIVICAITTALSIVAKPSFIICLLPAAAITMICLWIKKQELDWKLFIYGIIMPAVLILAMQYAMTYSTAQSHALYREDSKIIFAPFQVMHYYSAWLLWKFLLSILFPITVFIAYFKKAFNNRQLMLAWLTFLVGAFYAYFLAESGPRMNQGNMVWSAQTSAFLLFFISAVFVVQQERAVDTSVSLLSRKRVWFCGLIYCLHLASGILFYILQYTGPEEYCW
jgi:hypothetical protein